MCANDFGAGPSLDSQWDLFVDESNGDLAFSEGGEELRKDLAFNVGVVLAGEVGSVLSQGQLRDLEILVKRIIQDDPRIDAVDSIKAHQPAQNEEIEIDAVATTVDGTEFEQVFTLS
jgi:hypothetical protein